MSRLLVGQHLAFDNGGAGENALERPLDNLWSSLGRPATGLLGVLLTDILANGSLRLIDTADLTILLITRRCTGPRIRRTL
jgi:hypothetical protein